MTARALALRLLPPSLMDLLRPRFSLLHVVLFVGAAVVLRREEPPIAPPAPTVAPAVAPPRVAALDGFAGLGDVPSPSASLCSLMPIGGVARLVPRGDVVDRAEPPCVLPWWAPESAEQLAASARIVPAFRDGAPLGFKLYSIRPGSPYSWIGLKNGDVIKRINGHELTDPDKALWLYSELREATSWDIELERDGSILHKTCRR